jgi:hypothetical protein
MLRISASILDDGHVSMRLRWLSTEGPARRPLL